MSTATPPLTLDDMQARLNKSPFNSFLGLRLLSTDPEGQTLSMRCDLRPEFERMAGSRQFHGGVIGAIIDAAGQYVAMMLVGKPLATINFRTDYLRPATDTHLVATARILRLGRSICVCDIDVRDAEDRLIASGRASYAVPA